MMPEYISSFFTHPILGLFGVVQIVLVTGTSIYIFVLVCKGALPIWWRLGKALAKRKIAIIANTDNFSNLESVLVDSTLFRKKNICHVDSKSIHSISEFSLILVHWESCAKQIDKILVNKIDSAMLIIYAPIEEGRIESSIMQNINEHRNVIVVNFRGRLINDVFVCMMTSSP